MLRVALVRDFDEARLFGVRWYADRLRRSLAGRCEAVDVYPWPRRSVGPELVRVLHTLAVKELFYPLEVRRLAGDVAHIVDQSHAGLVDWIEGCATVVTCHDLWGLRFGSAARRFGYRRRVGALRRATRVIAVSESTRREAIAIGVEAKRVALVRNRVDACFLERPGAEELRAVTDRFGAREGGWVLHVGNVLPYKNLDVLIQALAEIRQAAGRRLVLVKVGAEPTAPQQRIANQAGVTVRWLGELSSRELRAAYHVADCLAYPSRHEGFGWPVAEALACGLPVVAGATGALPEIAADAALLVDPSDTGAVSAAIQRLFDEPDLRAELAERGRRRGTWLASGDPAGEVLEVYAEAVAARVRR